MDTRVIIIVQSLVCVATNEHNVEWLERIADRRQLLPQVFRGWDIPLHLQAADYRANPRPGVIWQAHYVGIEKKYCQIEKLANLDQLPPFGFKVACFPAKIRNASAGWTRAVAILEG
jgi:kynurenine formamidase